MNSVGTVWVFGIGMEAMERTGGAVLSQRRSISSEPLGPLVLVSTVTLPCGNIKAFELTFPTFKSLASRLSPLFTHASPDVAKAKKSQYFQVHNEFKLYLLK